MRTKHIIILAIISILIFALSIGFQLIIDATTKAALLTVASIFFAFIISAISAMYGKSYLKKLAMQSEKQTKKAQNQLQTLKNYFMFSIINLIILITIDIISLVVDISIYHWCAVIFSGVILSLTGISILVITMLTIIVLNAMYDEAQSN